MQLKLFSAIGGYDGQSRLRSVERLVCCDYSPRWEYVADMQVGRSNFAATVVDGMILAMGGYTEHFVMSQNERYCGKKDVWTTEVRKMKIKRSAHSAVTLSGKKQPWVTWWM
jgi:hypothetical protein